MYLYTRTNLTCQCSLTERMVIIKQTPELLDENTTMEVVFECKKCKHKVFLFHETHSDTE